MTRFSIFHVSCSSALHFFALEMADTAVNYCRLPSDGIFCSLVLLLGICLPLCGYIFPHLLLPVVAEFFSFSVLFLQRHRLTTRPFFCFQKVVLLEKLVVSPLPTDPGLFLSMLPVYWSFLLPHHIWDCARDASRRVRGSCEFSTWGFGGYLWTL